MAFDDIPPELATMAYLKTAGVPSFGEPWNVVTDRWGNVEVFGSERRIARMMVEGGSEDRMPKPHAERIVAAVNACAGLDLRADVPVGAMATLVEAIDKFLRHDDDSDPVQWWYSEAKAKVIAALAALTGDDSHE